MDIHKNKGKKIFVVALALILIFQTFFNLDIFHKRIKVKGADWQFAAGDWVYLDTSQVMNGAKWSDSSAQMYAYIMGGNYNTYTMKMQKVSDDLYRVKTPSDSTAILFRRMNNYYSSEYVDGAIWNSKYWGSSNPEYQYNQSDDLYYSAASTNNSNTYKITSWNGGKDGHSGGQWIANTWNTVSKAGKTIYFKNMDLAVNLSDLKAVFYSNDDTSVPEVTLNMSQVSGIENKYSVQIPADSGKLEYNRVRFMNGTEVLADVGFILSDYNENTKNTYYYRTTVKNNGTVNSGFDEAYDDTANISGDTLYFDSAGFTIDEENLPTIQIGNSSPQTIVSTKDSYKNVIYKYAIPEGTVINQQTVITLTNRGSVYHFNWKDASKNKVVVTAKGDAAVNDTYVEATGKTRTIYYDANLSNLQYTQELTGDKLNYEIPRKDTGLITYYATSSKDGTKRESGSMVAVPSVTSQIGNVYSNVYKVELPEEYDRIVFANFNMTYAINYGGHGESTGTLEIPTNIANPCFYADSSDDIVYKDGQRKGYWAALGTVRSGEYEAKGANNVVDIPTGDFVRDSETYYVDTTFYDYYSDYELNGLNRDNYDEVGSTHRKYQQFRQFNLALSDYYSSTGAVSPIYWGNFQNYDGSHYNQIADTLNLYGSNNKQKFFYENNSMWGSASLDKDDDLRVRNGDGTTSDPGVYATQNLISNTLKDGQLTYNTTSGQTVVAPYFNKSFLEGNNSKNTVFGKVYDDVTFPFNKAMMKSQSNPTATGEVGYWYFNGTPLHEDGKYPNSDSLRMTWDPTLQKYFLKKTNEEVHGVDSTYNNKTHGKDMGKNFFPFNGSSQNQNSSTLNYGFAMKMEVKFTLTSNGKVKTDATGGNEYVPIEFNFAGDDDVWIFIDGKLALDIGGDHGRVSGRLTFADGDYEYYISGVKNPTGGGFTQNATGNFSIQGNPTDEHTLTMFYMERGLWESNLFVSFNFPDHNYLDVTKTVDTSNVNQDFTDYIQNVANTQFDFEVKNYATHYPAKEASDVVSDTGFIRKQYEISDYGSVGAGNLMVPNKAIYTKYTSDGSAGTQGKIDTSVNNGRFQLKTNEKVSFMDQFRRGSYLSLKEIIPQEYDGVFDTYWSMSENDTPITSIGTGGSSVTNGAIMNLTGIHSLEVDDGRTEAYKTGQEESARIENTGYTNSHRPDGSSFVFRSYLSPDADAKVTKLTVAYTNKVKVGELTVKKAVAEGSEQLSGKYNFTVSLNNSLFDGGARTIEFQLETGQEKKIEGIPYGTTYTITETTPEDGSSLASVTLSKQDAEAVAEPDITNISGKIENDSDKLVYQFNNTLQPPKTKIGITKVDADDSHTLGDVEFKLEKLKNDGTVDTSFTALTYTTNDDGKIETAELDSGTYQLTETKTQAGYQLLAKSIKIEIDRSAGGKTKVDGKEVDVTDDKIAITVANIKKFTLPSTGGRGRTIIVLTGIILMWISGLLYTLSQTKNRNIKKERRI